MPTPESPFLIDESQRREVDRLIEDGLLEELLPGVAGPAGCASEQVVRVAALALALPSHVAQRSAVAQRAAAWAWCGGVPPRTVDIAVPPGRSVPRLPLLAVHERRMPPLDVTVLATGDAALTLTTPTRTLVDLLRLLPEADALAETAPLAALPGVTAADVGACLERMPRARGVPRARRLAAALPLGAAPDGAPAQSMRLPVIR